MKTSWNRRKLIWLFPNFFVSSSQNNSGIVKQGLGNPVLHRPNRKLFQFYQCFKNQPIRDLLFFGHSEDLMHENDNLVYLIQLTMKKGDFVNKNIL